MPECIYIGVRLLKRGILAQTFASAENPTDANLHRCYKKATDHPMIGSVYELTLTEDGKLKIGGSDSPKYLRTIDNDDLVRGWQLEDKAAKVMHREKTSAKKEAHCDLIEKSLEPLRLALAEADIQTRRAMKVLILEYLDRGMPIGFGKAKAKESR